MSPVSVEYFAFQAVPERGDNRWRQLLHSKQERMAASSGTVLMIRRPRQRLMIDARESGRLSVARYTATLKALVGRPAALHQAIVDPSSHGKRGEFLTGSHGGVSARSIRFPTTIGDNSRWKYPMPPGSGSNGNLQPGSRNSPASAPGWALSM